MQYISQKNTAPQTYCFYCFPHSFVLLCFFFLCQLSPQEPEVLIFCTLSWVASGNSPVENREMEWIEIFEIDGLAQLRECQGKFFHVRSESRDFILSREN